MPLPRKRRADDSESDDEYQSPEPSNAQSRRRTAVDSFIANDSDEEDDSQLGATQVLGVNPMVKKMVRLALASEYSRQVIRRNDISQKVLGEGSRQFKAAFAGAQDVLKNVFGMQMIEQPMKDRLTVSQRRAAQRVDKPSSSSKSWTLVSTLPPEYRIPEILPPTKAPSSATESSYVALYTFIISLITLSGGSLAEQKLDRYLRRVNADTYTPLDRTEKLLTRLCKDGYLVRNRDVDGGEEVVEYLVGPRGKIEVGTEGVAGLTREVYGYGRVNRARGQDDDGDDDEAMEEFEQRLRRSLGFSDMGAPRGAQERGEAASQSGQPARRPRRITNIEDGDDGDD
ncbi:hypothetical protein D8B26_003221 [Coccidioides posadasii str. Silveira]|uniref:Uncharacterized protein n=3 Tax=Coccidioides posadasii TaxID=199306 RepID=E9D0D8_COCPS|nr:hypothetical protein CPC735_005760 [Coccidioides posadasii C735 delta SOWgp]EER26404.1 hypothetical protein CPC735_005760 [Coccidioides posadasii C735 delta SOWgp]EFW20391.1 conserved hypothetical protein [Coccidioides posadasii str. Silveira]KMM73046.1 hypothetical protein CPAG_09335 [Coccidioides posadasii RMSCC 3488]QVM08532.1 hypothetical protein D8B26_003221 [Coccidioides posadasii str. Silveira]|eukprot:XP_003068549.1 hypothetical protein CPC735_005760 [Coccidioides posadasii C735 delta SOWgp]